MPPTLTVLLLAGSRGGVDPVAAAAGVPHKALAPVAGRPMICHVVDTLRALPEVRRIILLSEDPDALRQADSVARAEADGLLVTAPAAGSPARSVLAGLDHPEAALPVMVATADAPLLTPGMVRSFWAALPAETDMAVAVTPGAGIRHRFPDGRRTFLRFRDGDVSGCNLFAIATPAARAIFLFWRRIEAHRKRPLAMAGLIGPLTLLLYLTRRMRMADLTRRLTRKTGARAALVPIPFPEAAVDVDKPEDLAVVEKVLAERRREGKPFSA